MFRRGSPSAFLPEIEASSARSRESPVASCFSVAVGSCHTGGPFLLRTGAAEGGLGGTKSARSPSSVAGSRLSSAGSFLGAAQEVGHHNGMIPLRKGSLIFIFIHVLCMSWICWVCKTRQIQNHMLHCGVLSWRGVQAKSWTSNFVSCWVQLNGLSQIIYLRKGKQVSQAHKPW